MMCAEKEWMQMGMLAFTDAYSLLKLQGRSPHSFQCFFFFIYILSLVKQNFKTHFSAIAILFIEDDSPLG